YADTGQRDTADAMLASLANGAVTDAKALIDMGMAAAQLEDLPLAERFFREAVEREPQVATAREHLGVVLGMQGRSADAAAQFEAAVRLDPSRGTAHFHLAVAYAQLGRFREARAHAEDAARLNPRDGAAQALLARLPGS
ncbi:MAG: tetratricopeptide repeat protein, partial [Bacteroidales bacterium]